VAGDRVFGTGLHTERFQEGSCAEYVVAPVDIAAPLPENVSFTTAAGAALVGATAWRGLVDHADLQPTDTCLIHGASGGVGHVAVRLADALSATIIATAGSEKMQCLVEDLGADVVINYRRDDLRDAIAASVSNGIDVVFDHMVHRYLQLDVAVAGFSGDIVVYGGGDGKASQTKNARGKELSITMMSMSNLATSDETPQMTTVLRKVVSLLDAGLLNVEVARTCGLEDVSESHRAIMEDSYPGKLIVSP